MLDYTAYKKELERLTGQRFADTDVLSGDSTPFAPSTVPKYDVASLVKEKPDVDPEVYQEGIKQYEENLQAGMRDTGDRVPASAFQSLGEDRIKRNASGFLRRALVDPAVSLVGKGVIGAGETAVGAADLVTGGYAGKALADLTGYNPRVATEAIESLRSPEAQRASRKVSNAEGILGKAAAALQNPSTIADAALSSVPSMIGGWGIAKKLVPIVGQALAGGIGEGLVTAAQTAESVRQESPDKLLSTTQIALSLGAGAATGVIGAISGRVAQKLGLANVDTLFSGKPLSEDLRGKAIRRIVGGVLEEGLLEELPQSVQEQMAQNLALDKPLTEGVDEAAVMGALSGGLMGGVVNVKPGYAGALKIATEPGKVNPAAAQAPPVTETPEQASPPFVTNIEHLPNDTDRASRLASFVMANIPGQALATVKADTTSLKEFGLEPADIDLVKELQGTIWTDKIKAAVETMPEKIRQQVTTEMYHKVRTSIEAKAAEPAVVEATVVPEVKPTETIAKAEPKVEKKVSKTEPRPIVLPPLSKVIATTKALEKIQSDRARALSDNTFYERWAAENKVDPTTGLAKLKEQYDRDTIRLVGLKKHIESRQAAAAATPKVKDTTPVAPEVEKSLTSLGWDKKAIQKFTPEVRQHLIDKQIKVRQLPNDIYAPKPVTTPTGFQKGQTLSTRPLQAGTQKLLDTIAAGKIKIRDNNENQDIPGYGRVHVSQIKALKDRGLIDVDQKTRHFIALVDDAKAAKAAPEVADLRGTSSLEDLTLWAKQANNLDLQMAHETSQQILKLNEKDEEYAAGAKVLADEFASRQVAPTVTPAKAATPVKPAAVTQPVKAPGLLSKTFKGTHKSSNMESLKNGFEQRRPGISIARTVDEELSSPTVAEAKGTKGRVEVRVTGKGLDYKVKAHRDFIEGLFDEAMKHDGPQDYYVLDKLRSMGVDWVDNFNGLGKAAELHVINAKATKIVGEAKEDLRGKALRRYYDYVNDLSGADQQKVKHLIEEKPASPSLLLMKIQKTLGKPATLKDTKTEKPAAVKTEKPAAVKTEKPAVVKTEKPAVVKTEKPAAPKVVKRVITKKTDVEKLTAKKKALLDQLMDNPTDAKLQKQFSDVSDELNTLVPPKKATPKEQSEIIRKVGLSHKLTSAQAKVVEHIAKGGKITFPEGKKVAKEAEVGKSTFDALEKKGVLSKDSSGQYKFAEKFTKDTREVEEKDYEDPEVNDLVDMFNKPMLSAKSDQLVATGMSRQNLAQEIMKILGTKKVPDFIKVRSVQSEIDADILAALDKNEKHKVLIKNGVIYGITFKNKIYLIAESFKRASQVMPVLVHEAGHFLRAFDTTYSRKYDELMKYMQNGQDMSTEDQKVLSRLWDEITAREKGRLDKAGIENEVVMNYMQYVLETKTPEKHGFFMRLVKLFKNWVYKTFNRSAKELGLTTHDIAKLMIADLKLVAKDFDKYLKTFDGAPQEGITQFSAEQDETYDAKQILRALFGRPETKEEASAAYNEDLVQANEIVGEKFKDPAIKTLSKLTKRLFGHIPEGVQQYTRDDDGQTTNIFTRIFSLPEYYLTRDNTAAKVYMHAERQTEIKYTTEHYITGETFGPLAETLQKKDPLSYEAAQKYLLEADKMGRGYSVRLKNKQWHVISPLGAEVFSYSFTGEAYGEKGLEAEAAAVAKMTSEESKWVRAKGFSEPAVQYIKEFRDLTNRGFEISAAEMRRQIKVNKDSGLPEPQISYVNEEKKREVIPLSVAIAKMGELRGTYFPRERPRKKHVLIAKKPGQPNILIPISLYLPANAQGNAVKEALKSAINANLPVRKEVQKLIDKGYKAEDITIGLTKTPSDVIFDTPGLISAMDTLFTAAEEQVESDNMTDIEIKQLEAVSQQLSKSIGDIYKAKGSLSSRMKRAETPWEGHEEDPTKAAMTYAQRLAAGVSRRTTARNMLEAFTGRDVSWADYKSSNPTATYKDYRSEVRRKAINSTTQKNLYDDVRTYMTHVLRPDTQIDRFVGYLKGIAVLKYLGLRVSSAAVNATNMALAAPATIAAHTGLSITESWGEITRATAKYLKYRAAILEGSNIISKGLKDSLGRLPISQEDKEIFDIIAERGWDEANFNQDSVRQLQSTSSELFNDSMAAAMYMFGAVEKSNRATTIFAAYKAFKKANPAMPREEALMKAQHASNRTHGVYGKAAKPWLVQKVPFLDLPYTFFKFQQNYILNMIELGSKYPGGIKSVPYMLIAPAVLAGAGTSLITPILTAILQAAGLAGDDPEEEFYAWAEENLGSDAFARHGLAGLANINLKGSLQMSSPLPDLSKGWISLAGAPGGVFVDIGEALKHAYHGEGLKALEKAMPTAGGSLWKGWREYTEGVTTSDYAPVFYDSERLKGSKLDFALRFLAFNPARLAGIRQKQWKANQVRLAYQEERSRILSGFKHLLVREPSSVSVEEYADLYKSIQEYNESVFAADPQYVIPPITGQWLQTNLKRAVTPDKYERRRE